LSGSDVQNRVGQNQKWLDVTRPVAASGPYTNHSSALCCAIPPHLPSAVLVYPAVHISHTPDLYSRLCSLVGHLLCGHVASTGVLACLAMLSSHPLRLCTQAKSTFFVLYGSSLVPFVSTTPCYTLMMFGGLYSQFCANTGSLHVVGVSLVLRDVSAVFIFLAAACKHHQLFVELGRRHGVLCSHPPLLPESVRLLQTQSEKSTRKLSTRLRRGRVSLLVLIIGKKLLYATHNNIKVRSGCRHSSLVNVSVIGRRTFTVVRSIYG